MIKLNLGCGGNHMLGFVNIDKSRKAYHPDLILDLEKGNLPYKDNSIDEIMASHILEHIRNLIPLMNDCYRVLKIKGIMKIYIPQGEGIWADPTHVRAFSKLSFRYFCGYSLSDIYGITCKFKLVSQNFIDNEDGGVLEIILEK